MAGGRRPDGIPAAAAPRSATERYASHCRWLEAAAHLERNGTGHPVVRLLHRDPERLAIATLFAGTATAFSRPLSPPSTAQLLTAVAAALGRLHASGLVHGNVTGDHILIRGSRFSLCSPSGRTPDDGLEPADDVAAFAPLITGLLSLWDAPRSPWTLDSAAQRRWEDLSRIACDPSMSAARLARRLESLQ